MSRTTATRTKCHGAGLAAWQFKALRRLVLVLPIIAAQNILLQSGQDTTTSTSSSHSSSGSIGAFVGAGGGYGVQASGALAESKGNGNSVTQVNSQVAAGNTLTLNSGGNTTLAGAQGSAANIIANVGGDLNIISRQNTSSETYSANSGGASVSVGAAGGSGSGSFSNTSINDNSATVGAGQQSGLTASQNLTAKVAGNTDLNGGILNAPAGSLTTGSLTSENIQNKYAASGSTIGVSGSSNGYMPSGVLPSGSSTSASGTGTTYGTVGPDIIINAASGIPANLNRDTATANGAVNDNFNLSKSETKLETQQIGAQLFGQVANTAAGKLIDSELGGNEDSMEALLLHAAIGAAQGAIAGGGAGSSIAGGAAGATIGTYISPALVAALDGGNPNNLTAGDRTILTATSSLVGALLGGAAGGGAGAAAGSSGAAYSTTYNCLEDGCVGETILAGVVIKAVAKVIEEDGPEIVAEIENALDSGTSTSEGGAAAEGTGASSTASGTSATLPSGYTADSEGIVTGPGNAAGIVGRYSPVSGATDSSGNQIYIDASGNYYTLASSGATRIPSPNLPSSIGATGQIGEDALKALGGESQVTFQTNLGARVVDQLVDGVANEAKVGATTLDSGTALQIAKDAELLQSGAVQGVTWNFYTSPVTGLGGPSQPLLNALTAAGIHTVIH